MWGTGEAYEPFMGRWSRAVAAAFVRRLDLPPGLDWLDVGCGTGAVTREVLRGAGPAGVTGVDRSEDYVRHARRHVRDPRARFVRGDAEALPLPDARAAVAVSGLVLNFVPGPARAAAELVRVVRPGGTVGVYLWDYADDGMGLLCRFWEAAAALDPGCRSVDERARFPLCGREPLRALLTGAGLAGVTVSAIEVPTVFRDFADYWDPFLGGQGPAPGYVASLGPARRAALRERLRATLPRAADGSVPLTARAWSATGRRPGP
ncbi:class I SAM-dependent methyltransferase [Streptomyces sp. NPDC048507]|uniref:class I SAM-dependent methyltransferase n=1 Tax=Streptomyces sp. NPDC048507 TaxID=3365560 RepID=UPI003711F898